MALGMATAVLDGLLGLPEFFFDRRHDPVTRDQSLGFVALCVLPPDFGRPREKRITGGTGVDAARRAVPYLDLAAADRLMLERHQLSADRADGGRAACRH